MIEDVSLPHAFLNLDELQSHAWTNLEWTDTHKHQVEVAFRNRCRYSPCVPAALGGNTHLRQTDSALLRRHVAAPRADLRQLRYVVLTILFCFALRQVGPPEDAKHCGLASLNGLLRQDDATERAAHFISSSLMSSNLFMLGKRSCISFLTPRLIPTGTTFMLLQEGTANQPVSGTFQ